MNGKPITCPYCSKQFTLSPDAGSGKTVICPNCYRDLALTTPETVETLCPFCGEPVSKYSTRCSMCGEVLTSTQPKEETKVAPQAQATSDSGINLFLQISFIFLLVSFVIVMASVAIDQNWLKKTTQTIKIFNPELKEKTDSFIESGHELLAAWSIGMSRMDFRRHLVKVKARWDMVCEHLPENHKAREKINKAIAAWAIAHTIWDESIGEKNTEIYLSKQFYIYEDFLAREIYPGQDSSWRFKKYNSVLQDVMKYANDSYREGSKLLND